MTNFIPIFPLPIVVFPDEEVHIHVDRPEYQQLISDCAEQDKKFGIPVVIDKEMKDIGTLAAVRRIMKTYDSGEMDVVICGESVFRILEPIHKVPKKLYKGAIVYHVENRNNGRKALMDKVMTAVQLLHQSLKVHKDFRKDNGQIRSYDIAHHAGLSLLQEYELLELTDELHRQEYLRRHLNKTIPVISAIENLKERIRMNGHFRRLK